MADRQKQAACSESVNLWTHESLLKHLTDIIEGKDRLNTVISNERDRRYEERFEAQENAMNTALVSAKEALAKADAVNTTRLEHLNQFRAAMQDRDREFMPRREVEIVIAAMQVGLKEQAERIAASENVKVGAYKTIAIVSALITLGMAVLGFVSRLRP